MGAPTAAGPLAGLAFEGDWRRYQTLALDAFDADVAARRRRTHIVAPPGSGKTLLGMEIVRRLGAPALVLVPNSAVQAQWLRTAGRFGAADGVAAADASAPIACLTYQALCQLDDPATALGDLAERRWTAERATASGQTVDEVAREAATWTGEAATRRRRELARISASLKREIARAEHGSLGLGDLLAPGARRRLDTLRANGVGTIVLDECHHLASLWGYVVRTAVEELGDIHLVGLTATPPDELTREEDELYAALLGPVDFSVPTPAVVRERFLAPYQELAWLTRPLDSESAWLTEHDQRFRELVTALHDDAGGVTSLPEWVIGRMRQRGRGAGEEAAVSWGSFQKSRPALARAGARFLTSAGLTPPPGMPRGEGYREQPNLDDWLVLLEDYALHCLAADPGAAAASRYEAIGAALRSLGFTLTRRGIRRGASDVDRLLTGSAAKPIALVEVLACEYAARGDGLRALVLADAERSAAVPDAALTGVLRADAGTAPEAVRAVAGDDRTALRPLLVSGRGLRCSAADAEALLAALQAYGGDGLTDWRAEPGGDGLVQLLARGPDWQPRVWVDLATRIFTDGATQVLVGTRALLGEGWDAPCVNCLVDMSAATTSVSVTQMRGRSLRLDPADPDKIASNWDLVCVAPELARGTADYERFVRKHVHLFAPSEDGAIEAGPSHVHPALGPFAPPPDDRFAEINREMARRSAEHDQARERWGIGQPYTGEEHETLVIRPRAVASARPANAATPPVYPLSQAVPFSVAGASAAAFPVLAVTAGTPALLVGLAAVPAALAWATRRLATVRRELPAAMPLDLAARAVCDTYVELGELRPKAAASLAIEPRASGYLRCFLRDAAAEETGRFVQALDQAVSAVESPRYLVSRLVPTPGRGPLTLLWLALRRRSPFEQRWSAVPDDLGRQKDRAEAFARAWRRWAGPSELRFTQRSEEGRDAAAAAGAQAEDYETSARRVWV